MATHPVSSPASARLAGGTDCRWLMLAAETAGLAHGNWRPSPDPGAAGRSDPPRIAMRTPGTDAGSVRAARDFTLATLRRWNAAERSEDIAIVVAELLTNALRHALPGLADSLPGGRSGSACCSRDLACCARSPTPARRLRCPRYPVP